MTALDHKLRRDLLSLKGQVLAISLVIACGVATLVMSLSVLASLRSTIDRHYDRYHFADVFARLKRAPDSLSAHIAAIPGVAHVQTRVLTDVTLDIPNFPEPAVARLISLPRTDAPGLNDLYLRAGRRPEPGRTGEVLAGEAFTEAHHLRPGDSVRVIINGRLQRLTIVGVVLSPEYVFQMREGDFVPDDRRFGVFWMRHDELAAAYNMEGAFNSVTLKLSPSATEPDVLARLDRLIEPYGGLGAYGRDDHLSHRFLSDELKQLRVMAVFSPLILFSVAAFLLNVVLSRLVSTQREQIATLKAFGYTGREIRGHYVKLVIVVVLLGSALGCGGGAWFARILSGGYEQFYRFPAFELSIPPAAVVLSVLVSAAAAVGGVLGAVRRATALAPAEAMRPEAPATYRPLLAERLGFARLWSASARMVLRHLERRPLRAALSAFGIALGTSILVVGSFQEDVLDFLINFQFFAAQHEDMTVAFAEPAAARTAHELENLPGVLRVEPFRTVPVRLRHGHHSRRLALQGMPPRSSRELSRLLDVNGREVDVPADGVLLSAKLAEVLGVKPGQAVTAEVLEGERPVRELPVVATVDDASGINAYMDLRAANRLMREGDVISGAALSTDPAATDALYAALKQMPRVAGVGVKAASMRSFEQTIAENIRMMRSFNLAFAAIIAFGVVYNTARISLSERSRELASLRVLGFTRREISSILLSELATLTVLAIPLGLLIGTAMAAALSASMDTESYRFPLVIRPATFGYAAVTTAAAALASALIVRRRIDKLDLVAVLKSRD
jgi:putative ABC transport system permease protein